MMKRLFSLLCLLFCGSALAQIEPNSPYLYPYNGPAMTWPNSTKPQVAITGQTTPKQVSGGASYLYSYGPNVTQGGYAYGKNVSIFDWQYSPFMSLVGSYSGTCSSARWALVQGGVYYGSDNSNFCAFNIQNPSSPSLLGYVSSSNLGPAISGRYVYGATFSAGSYKISSVDFSNPSSPILYGSSAGSVTANTFGGSVISNRYYYAIDGTNANIVVYDIANPFLPALAGSVAVTSTTSPTIKGIVLGRYLYEALSDGIHTATIYLVDTIKPSSPSISGSITLSNNFIFGISVSGKLLYVTTFPGGGGGGNNYIYVYDVSKPSSPTLLSSFVTTFGAFAIADDFFMTNGRYLNLADQTPLYYKFDIGGQYLQQADIGSLYATDINVFDRIDARNIDFWSGGISGPVEIMGDANIGSHPAFAIGNTPTIATCSSVSGNDSRGTVSIGGGTPTSCVMTFARPYSSAPFCVASASDTAHGPVAITGATATSVTFGMTSTLTGSIYYRCIQ